MNLQMEAFFLQNISTVEFLSLHLAMQSETYSSERWDSVLIIQPNKIITGREEIMT